MIDFGVCLAVQLFSLLFVYLFICLSVYLPMCFFSLFFSRSSLSSSVLLLPSSVFRLPSSVFLLSTYQTYAHLSHKSTKMSETLKSVVVLRLFIGGYGRLLYKV